MIKISPHIIPFKNNRVYALIIHYVFRVCFSVVQLVWLIFPPKGDTLSIDLAKNILVIRTDGLGDVVMSTAAFKAIRDKFPDARVTLLAATHSKQIVEVMSSFDEVIYFDAPWVVKEQKNKFKNFFHKIKELRDHKFDLAIGLRGDFRNNILMYCLGVEHRLGFNITGCDFLLTSVIYSGPNHHPVNLSQSLIWFLGLNNNEKYGLSLELTNADRKFADDFFRDHGIRHQDLVVMIHPGAKWSGRKWIPDRFAQMADHLITDHKAKVIISGGPNESDVIQNINDLMKQTAIITPPKIPLRYFLALLAKCDLFVGVDSGPMHMSTALNVRVVAIFGPARPESVGPKGENHIVVTEQENYSCSPCSQTVCDVPNNCMNAVSVEKVMTAVKKQINGILSEKAKNS